MVMERWEIHYFGECSSWLRSHTSGKRYCSSPPFEARIDSGVVADAGPKYDETKTDKATMLAVGEEVYTNTCALCHQADGMGTPGVYPPLAGAGEFYGDARNMSTIIVNGLSGVEIMGKSYSGVMAPQGAVLSDYEIAAAASFVRNSFGNNDGMVTKSDVAAVR